MDASEPMPGVASIEAIKQPKESIGASTAKIISATPTEAKLDIEQAKEELIDPRAISKKTDVGGRIETARAILEARANARSTQEEITEKEQKVREIAELTSSSYQREREKIGELNQRLEALVVKLKNAIGIGDRQAAALRDEIGAIKSERNSLQAIEDELKALKGIQAEIPDPKQLLEAYYEKVAIQPLSHEQKRKLLKPEVLASLSTEEYIALWRRLNPYFLTHVTQQGFRDHTGEDFEVNHERGYRKFTNGFVDVMRNGRIIFPPLARIDLINREEKTVKTFLSNFLSLFSEASNAKEAKKIFLKFLNFSLAAAPKYPDITAIHLAAQMVSDIYYGGERNNEVFFVHPSDVLASQYTFGSLGGVDFTRPRQEKYNDVFIWTDPNHPGLPVDSGIVFLPEKTPVDPETGSKYASEVKVVDGHEKRVMIENTALISSFVDWGKKLDDQSPLKQASKAYKKEQRSYYRKERLGHYDYYHEQELKDECFTIAVQELEGLGFKADALAALASKLIGEMYWRDSFDEKTLRGIIERSGAHQKLAESTVPAKEYWESFFAKNPGLRPKHIQYYDGNPTTAVLEFQRENNIGRADTSKTDGQLLGFDDHHVLDMEKDPRANVGYNELVATADKIIRNHYGAKTVYERKNRARKK